MDGENLSSLQIETGIREWLLEMDLENSRRVVKKQVPEVPLYQLLYEQKTYLPCGGIRLAWGHFMLLFWTLALKKKWGISVKLVHLVQSVEWQGGFIMCPWTRSQKYVFHWPGRSEEVLWLRTQILGFPGGPVVKNPPANAREADLIPGFGRSPGKGNGNPLQYSCLENSMDRPMDRGTWWATVHRVAKSQTRLSD